MRFLLPALVLGLSLSQPAGAISTRIHVEEPSGVARKSWPVTSGVPFVRGSLKDAHAVALFSGDEKEIPLQAEVLARWPDGSVRWLLLDFQVDLAAKEKKQFVLRYGQDVRRSGVENPVQVQELDDRVVVNTGPLRLELRRNGFDLLNSVWMDVSGDGKVTSNERVTGPERSGIVTVDSAGKEFLAALSPAEITVEQAGPLRACVRVSGHHASGDEHMFRYVVRIHAFRGQPFVRFFYTFINDHQNSLMAKIKELNLVLHLTGDGSSARFITLDNKTVVGTVLQADESHYELNGKPSGTRAAGWAAIGSGKAGVAVGLREFWQNWPKGITADPRLIKIGICPELRGDLYGGKPLEEENKLYYHVRDGYHTFKVGVARTHELWATFFAGPVRSQQLSDFFKAAEDPLLATCEPAHVSATGAAGEFPPADPARYFGYDAWFSRALAAHLQRRENVREYGMLNYGDWYGERRVNWGNLEYDLAHGLFLQYLRSGDRRFFLRAEQAARHHIDVDVVHATNPHLKNPWGSSPQVGEVWLHCLNHTGGYYNDAPLPVSRTYQMGHSTNFGHVWITGDLDYYYLTGDRRALNVSIEMADAMVRHMPTRYGTHIRALGWPMILVLAAYEVTGDKKYLEAATKNWHVLKENIDWEKGWVVRLAGDHCLHPRGSSREERNTIYREQRCQGNVPFMEGLTLCALARYHRVTGDPEVLKAITVGVDQMIRECWQEDAKTFRYTACPLSSPRPYSLFMLSAEAMAYEVRLTGDLEHLRILREGFRAAIPKGDGHHFGKSLGQMTFFAPHALSALED